MRREAASHGWRAEQFRREFNAAVLDFGDGGGVSI
jgi:hypothetical protein